MMRRILPAALVMVLVAVAALSVTSAAGSRTPIGRAHLTGDQEVPPFDTLAQGQAQFHFRNDGSIGYKLNVAKIENITQSQIHCGPAGTNGPVVVFLFGFVSAGVTLNGILAEGSFSEGDLIPRPDSAACPGGSRISTTSS